MHVAVGSTNPVKERATKQVLTDTDTVVVVDVDSGVPEQPRGRAETVQGAENRARRAHEQAAVDLAVGIEGGVAELDGVDGLFLIMWAAATDGERTGRAGGPTLRLPASLADPVRDGRELGPVLDKHLDRDGVAREEGAAGLLTGGAIDRTDALAHAVAGALGPFTTAEYTDSR